MGIFLILVSSALLGLGGFGERAIAISVPLHKICQEMIPAAQFRPLYQALVCGTNLPPSHFQENLRQTGLLHIVVVSGSHLLWLEALLRRLLGRSRAADLGIFAALLIFVGSAQCQPPVVRAALSLLTAAIAKTLCLGWTSVQIALLSGLMSLALFPFWLDSVSLLLSWTAALALASCRRGTGPWRSQVRVYLCLFVCLLPLAPPHPTSIFFNVIAGPLLGAVLFPASLATCFIPPLIRLLDPFCSWLENGLAILAAGLPPASDGIPVGKSWLWTYLLLLNFGLAIREIYQRRHS